MGFIVSSKPDMYIFGVRKETDSNMIETAVIFFVQQGFPGAPGKDGLKVRPHAILSFSKRNFSTRGNYLFYCVEQESLQAEESFMLAAELDSWLNEHGLYQRKDNKVGAEGSKVLTRYIWLMCQHLVCQKIFRNS